MSKKPRKIKSEKKPIDILKNKVIYDANMVAALSDNARVNNGMFNIFQVILSLVRPNEALDNVIADANSQIGIFADDLKFVGFDYESSIGIIRDHIEKYQEFCKVHNIYETFMNLKKLKEYPEDNGIYGPNTFIY